MAHMERHVHVHVHVMFQLIQARLIPGLSRLNGAPERSLLRFQHVRSSFHEGPRVRQQGRGSGLPVRVLNPELALPHGATRKPT